MAARSLDLETVWGEHDGEGYAETLRRTKTPSGWLVIHTITDEQGVTSSSMTYVFDPDHKWKLKSIQET